MPKRLTSEEIDDAAALWAARCDRGDLSSSELDSLEGWLGADPRHRGAHARAMAVLAQFDPAKALGSAYNPAAFGGAAANAGAVENRRGFLRLGAGSAIAIGGAAAAVALWPRPSYATRRGEMRRVILSDRSVITLNTATALSVHYGPKERRVNLRSGEASFDVADDQRPFVVKTAVATVLVRSGEASYIVKSTADAVEEVVVRAGAISWKPETVETPLTLTASELGNINDGRPSAVDLSASELERKLAWQSGKIAFHDDTLEVAAREFARYSDTVIVVEDPKVANLRIVGLFSATKPEAFAQAVALSLGLRTRVEDGRILIEA